MTDDAKDAARYRWLKQYLRVHRDRPGDWACWLELKMLPFRYRNENVEEILDDMMKHYPLKEKK